MGTVVLLLALNLLNYIDRYILAGEVLPIKNESYLRSQSISRINPIQY